MTRTPKIVMVAASHFEDMRAVDAVSSATGG